MSEISERHDSSLFAVPDTAISGELNYIDEMAPFTRDDWSRAMKAMKPVKVSCETRLTEHGTNLLAQYAQVGVPDAISAEYTDGAGVKYAGTLYRVAPKEQG